MLTRREEGILKVVVAEHISTAAPVGSGVIARKYPIGLSPATIRSEMACLEEEGYITQPHPSAGRIPLEKGYRYYVETLMAGEELPQEEQLLIRCQLQQVGKELDEWLRLVIVILSRMVHNMALVTSPRAKQPRLKYLELVSLQEFLALLLLIFREARLKQRIIAFEEAVSQEELSAISNRLSATLAGLTSSEISALSLELSPIEEQVMEAVVEIMAAEAAEGEQWGEELQVGGLHYFLGQPEFAATSKALGIMELCESKELLRVALPSPPVEEELRLVIGRENKGEAMHECSVVLGCYGLPNEVSGTIGVVGPTRMDYERAVSAVRFLSATMSEIVSDIYR
jgi:heat-inducible transcriptional repressor